MVNTYQLVNPYIAGNFKTSIKAKNSLEAANLFYKNLSQHFNNSIPNFYFSVQKGGSGAGKHYHFEVNEKLVEDQVSFTVAPYNVHNNESAVEKFKVKLEEFKGKFNQDGGKKKKKKHHKHDSSDSDDLDVSSDEFYTRVQKYVPVTQPIYYYWYDPYIYNLNSVFIPSFYNYMNPYIELSFKIN